MVLNTITVGAAVTPVYTNRKPLHGRPTAHISYDEGLHLVLQFLKYASNHTVEEIQAFTAQWVPCPHWVKVSDLTIPDNFLVRSATLLQQQLGPAGLQAVGGGKWWQWRPQHHPLRAEWIEMRKDYNQRIAAKEPPTRTLMYIHGGAYYFGSVDEHRYQLQRHARKLKARLLAPRYRLAPQFPFPCGLQDALATYLYLLQDTDPSTIILAGDSAGAGMTVSLLVTLRDQGIPLPAGAILISPWVDLTHSFPSVSGDGEFDYIPAYGFHHRPSSAWPPPNSEEILASRGQESAAFGKKGEAANVRESEAVSGLRVHDPEDKNAAVPGNRNSTAAGPASHNLVGEPSLNLSLDIDGKHVEILDQIQMYAPNHLLAHPLVSPVMQPSLGGLPPLLIQTGGGELLKDEQVYLAHKAADPAAYPPPESISQIYDPDGQILKKYPPTNVQLQVWEDLCHVPHTLSFTRPAKYMYRAVAQFGNWCFANAQRTPAARTGKESVVDSASVISSDSSFVEGDDKEGSAASNAKPPKQPTDIDEVLQNNGQVPAGAAGMITVSATAPLPPFEDHMIRQFVTRYGIAGALPPPAELAGCSVPRSSIGVIKAGPVRKWLARKEVWDKKFSTQKRKVQKRRASEINKGYEVYLGDDGSREIPPATAMAGRRLAKKEKGDEDGLANLSSVQGQGKKKSWGLALWSGWGSKHDEVTLETSAQQESAADKEADKEDDEEEQDGTAAGSTGWLGGDGKEEDAEDDDTLEADIQRSLSISAALPAGEKVAGSENTFLAPSSNRPHNGVVAYPFKIRSPVQDPSRSASTMTLQSGAGVEGVVPPSKGHEDGGKTAARPALESFVTAHEYN